MIAEGEREKEKGVEGGLSPNQPHGAESPLGGVCSRIGHVILCK